MQITVTMERMLCAKPDTRWYFFRGLMGGDGAPETTVICKGSMGWQPGEMETLALIGDWTVYKGERQFQFRSAKLTLPLDPRSQLHYVCLRAHGIGISLEQAIWDARREDWRNLQRGEIRRMTDAAFDAFTKEARGFDANSEKAEIISWLENKGCSEGMAAAAYEAWGKDASGIVNANCYRLAELPGYSFRNVDEHVRRHFDIADDDPRRIRSAVVYAMDLETQDGSTAVNCWRHLAACQKLLPNIGDDLIVRSVREMKEEGDLHVFAELNMMALKRDYVNELIVAGYVASAVAAGADPAGVPDDDALAAGEPFTPDPSQLEAVRFAVAHKFAIVNGGAGVGKTTVIRMIVRGIREAFPHLGVRLCAPTGKAAARLKEASGIEATTIHVMLGAMGNGIFSAGPLDTAAVIVDESSMVDSALLAEILKRDPAKVVLVGDQAQLTPVGHGQPFHDIISLHPESIRTLTKCYRNTEAVFQAAAQIRNGNLPVRHAKSENEEWTVVAAPHPEEVQKLICGWAEEGVLDFSTDIVLCPKNGARGDDEKFQDATVNAFNEDLLEIDRRLRGTSDRGKFVRGDRLINTVNRAEAHVWNGTTGTVHAVDGDGGVWVELDVPFRDPATGEEKSEVLFDREMAKALRYAYALTVHKSQGSQYRKVVMAVLARDKFQLDRSLIYTGVTRTKEECVIVGDYAAFASGIAATRKKDSVLQCLALRDANQKGESEK
ncbi:MAG: AAA family ATPase [Lentisphaeria bacterium]|nr:AAA family ATPase [Lentisphaeria bacterium]